MQAIEEGYPQELFWIVAIAGLLLLLYKPKYYFWFTVFYFSARGLREAAFTRLELTGPYFNLDDLVIALLFLSLLRKLFEQRILIPRIVLLIMSALVIGFIVSILSFEITYEVKREMKYSLYLPIMIFIAYNYVEELQDLKIFLTLMFLGTIVASVQYLLMVYQFKSVFIHYYNQEIIRSVSFISAVPYFLVWIFFYKKSDLSDGILKKIIIVLGTVIFLISVILSQTKSIYLAVVLTIIVVYITYGKIIMDFKKFLFLSIIPISLFLVQYFFEFLDVRRLLTERIVDLYALNGKDVSTESRLAGLTFEMEQFINGPIIIGRGIGFHYFLPGGYDPNIAWGHMGHLSYLVRLGLIGFIVYSIYLPFRSISLSKKMFNAEGDGIEINFILFCIIWIILDWIMFWVSSSYLSITGILPGLMYGTLWGYYKNYKVKNGTTEETDEYPLDSKSSS